MRKYLAISLVISSKTMQPESISERVGVTPTETCRRGTRTRTGDSRRPEFDVHEWWIRDELVLGPGDRLEDLQPSFITKFLNNVSLAEYRIRELADSEHVKMIFVYQMDRVPYIGLSNRQTEKIAALGASIDLDIMID